MGRWDEARRLLCVGFDTIGGVLMCGPAMRALKTALPERRLTLLTSPAGATAAGLMDEVDDTITHVAPWTEAGARRENANAALDTLARIAAEHFDAAVVFTAYSQSPLPAALMCTLASVRLRLAHCRENPSGLLTDWVHETEPHECIRHEVRRQLDLVATVGARCDDERLRVNVPTTARRRIKELLDALELGDAWIVVHAGATAPARRYPPELLAQACRRLANGGHTLLFTGVDHERTLVADVRRHCRGRTYSLAGRLDLAGLAALLEAAPLLISGSTGPVHVAAAVGTPVVDLYALTNPQHTPWGVANAVLFNDVPCRWCHGNECPQGHHLCLRGVRPKRVVRVARALIDADDSHRPELEPTDGPWVVDYPRVPVS